MFSTFVGTSPRPLRTEAQELKRPSIPSRPKRAQVARACDYCRVHRIKCDNNQPCFNCQSRGGLCTNKGTSEVRTLPHAMREIERLQNRIKELEEQLERPNELVSHSDETTAYRSPAATDASRSSSTDHLRDHGNRAVWEGTFTSTAKSAQTQWYGPASALHFIDRMSNYLGTAFQKPLSHRYMQPKTASMAFASPTAEFDESQDGNSAWVDAMRTNADLTATQEDYFLNLFWQSYHCTYQIIDEANFKEHYRSLWAPSRTSRKPSALVDSVLALCVQLGVSFKPRGDVSNKNKTDVDGSDASIAGRWLYRRAQMLMSSELESPTLATLQCQLFCTVYLCNASYQNMAHVALASCIRIAQILGLHLEPPEDMPRAQRELRKRIWWTVYAIEVKTCMKLGRPWSAQLSQITCTLPTDDQELAFQSNSNFANVGGNVTWLTYAVQMIKLIMATRTVYAAYYEERERILGPSEDKHPFNDPELSDSLAEFLSTKMKHLDSWVKELPDALKTKRKGGAPPYSTDVSDVDIEVFAPLWLQRQRLLLELLYHNVSMSLLRPFICFFPHGFTSPKISEVALHCVRHAMAITKIMHQSLLETDVLTGWHEAYQWQWNSTLSMIGYILANPGKLATPAVRSTVDTAIQVFEILGNNFSMAISAAAVARDLAAKADMLANQGQPGLHAMVQCTGHVDDPGSIDNSNVMNEPQPSSAGGSLPEEPSAMMQDALTGYLGLAFNDSFNAFDGFLVDNVNFLPDNWNFTQG